MARVADPSWSRSSSKFSQGGLHCVVPVKLRQNLLPLVCELNTTSFPLPSLSISIFIIIIIDSLYEQLEEIVQLAARPIPERPDGIVCVVKFTSSTRDDCRATEAEYERVARENPATIFLRCFAEYQDADIVMAQAAVNAWPSYDIFYRGTRTIRSGVEVAKYVVTNLLHCF